MTLALFDLDHTLLSGDSDNAWGDFLRERGHVDEHYQREKARHFRDYQNGCLDFPAYAALVLGPLKGARLEDWLPLRREFAAERIAPLIREDGRAQIDWHRAQGHHVVIVTATNRFVAGAAAELLGVADLLASEPALEDQRYTGMLAGEPCFQVGKISHVSRFAAAQGLDWRGAYFYSDSHNDLPLLSAVAEPRVVTPDARLQAEAQARGWPVLTWR